MNVDIVSYSQPGAKPGRGPSRREFLHAGAAALTIGNAVRSFALADESVNGASAPSADRPRQAIACSRQEAADAAQDVLEAGGNAIDAAAAALMVLCVIEPHYVGWGGYGGSLVFYHASTGRVHAIDGNSRAPRKFDPASFNANSAQYGYLSIGVPGIVAGIDLALREHGSMPFKKLAQPALALAEHGTVVTPAIARNFVALYKRMDPASKRAYFLNNDVPAEGHLWVQHDLARLIHRLSDEGPASFYTGDVATSIARQIQANGGVLAEDDFHGFQASVVEPLHICYRGYDIYTLPPPSGGLTCLSVLKTLEQFDLAKYAPWEAPYIELFAGALNLAWAERFKYFGDPDFVAVPMAELLSEKRAQARAEVLCEGVRPSMLVSPEASHTVNLVVIDGQRNVASWTATHGGNFGSQVAIEGLGLVLGHGMSRFSLDSASPNFPAPLKRPQHNMAPLVILRDGKPYAGLGLPGGRMIVSVTPQLVVNLVDFSSSPEKAISAPRIHVEGAEPIQVTNDVADAVIQELRTRGHQIEKRDSIGGLTNIAVIDPVVGVVHAAASRGSRGVLMF